MNLTKFEQEKKTDDTPVPVAIRDRQGDPYLSKAGKPWTWYIVGEFSDVFRDREAQINRDLQRHARVGGKLDPEYVAEWNARRLAACVVRWENVEDADDVPIPFNAENAYRLLALMAWVKEQVREAFEAHPRFFEKSLLASATG